MVARRASSVRWVAAPPVDRLVDADAKAGGLAPVGSTDAVAADVRSFGGNPLQF